MTRPGRNPRHGYDGRTDVPAGIQKDRQDPTERNGQGQRRTVTGQRQGCRLSWNTNPNAFARARPGRIGHGDHIRIQ